MTSRTKSRASILALAVALVIWAVAPVATLKAETQSLETLLAYLKSPNVSTRKDAARKLGERRVRNQLAVEALAVASRKDEDAGVRAAAVESLGMIKDFSALPEMVGALKDNHSDVRRVGVRSLVALYTEHEIDFVTNVRSGWNVLNPFLDTNDREIIEPYQIVDPSIIRALGEAARGDREREVRIAAVRALGVLRGYRAIPQLADALNSDQDMRIEVLRAMIKIGDPSAGRHLIPYFTDSNHKVRTQAMLAAGLLKYQLAVEPLLTAYNLGPEKRGAVKKVVGGVKGLFSYLPARDEAALWALSLIGDEKAERVFVENMTSKDGDRRQYSFEGLARIGDTRYLDQITRHSAAEGNSDVRLAQYWALYKMGSRPNIQYVVRKLDTDQRQQARGYLMEADSPADLYPYVRSSSTTIRRQVIEILGRIGDESTIKELEPIARTSGAATADTATVAIKRIEWRQAGRPRAADDVLRREYRPR
ncbi:MAG TPA: HEAT repeat domain-containing protein [Blastocatellia bacterium]|nr:HEAT repeat domain-containing protein [Blastocatellia bacterium]